MEDKSRAMRTKLLGGGDTEVSVPDVLSCRVGCQCRRPSGLQMPLQMHGCVSPLLLPFFGKRQNIMQRFEIGE